MNTDLRAVGFNDEQTQCDNCGRIELRGTVIVADENGNEYGRYGTTCASRVLGVKITRNEARSREASRRSVVATQIGLARKELAAGRLDWVRMYVTDLEKFYVLHREDERNAVATLKAAC